MGRSAGACGVRPWIAPAGGRNPDKINRSKIATVVCVPLTSNLHWADAPGNVALPARLTDLPRDSVANVSQIVAIDKGLLLERVGRLSASKLNLLLAGVDVILGR